MKGLIGLATFVALNVLGFTLFSGASVSAETANTAFSVVIIVAIGLMCAKGATSLLSMVLRPVYDQVAVRLGLDESHKRMWRP